MGRILDYVIEREEEKRVNKMTTKQQLEAQAEELRNKLNELESTIKNMPERDDMNVVAWRPKEGQTYYDISDGTVDDYRYFDKDIYNRAFEIGLAFKTEEEAEGHLARMKMHQKIKELAGGYEFKKDDHAYTLCYNLNDEGIHVFGAYGNVDAFTVYFKSEHQAKLAIGKFAKEEWQNYFNVK